jgi:hypothetical protein
MKAALKPRRDRREGTPPLTDDLKKLSVQRLRELARVHLGKGHSRLRTKAELLAALKDVLPSPLSKVLAAAKSVLSPEKRVRVVDFPPDRPARPRETAKGVPAESAPSAGRATTSKVTAKAQPGSARPPKNPARATQPLEEETTPAGQGIAGRTGGKPTARQKSKEPSPSTVPVPPAPAKSAPRTQSTTAEAKTSSLIPRVAQEPSPSRAPVAPVLPKPNERTHSMTHGAETSSLTPRGARDASPSPVPAPAAPPKPPSSTYSMTAEGQTSSSIRRVARGPSPSPAPLPPAQPQPSPRTRGATSGGETSPPLARETGQTSSLIPRQAEAPVEEGFFEVPAAPRRARALPSQPQPVEQPPLIPARDAGTEAPVLLVRDPTTLFVFWDFRRELERGAALGLREPRTLLRLYQGETLARSLELPLRARSTYVAGLRGGEEYTAEVAFLGRDGWTRPVGRRSAPRRLPPGRPSERLEVRTLRLPWSESLERPPRPSPPQSPHIEPLDSPRRIDLPTSPGAAGGPAGGPSSPRSGRN